MVEEQKSQTVGDAVADEKPEEVAENGATSSEKSKNDEEGKDEPKNGKENEEDENEEDEESSDEELGSLEKPVEILYTKRERKSVDAYVEKPKEEKKEVELDYSSGKGVKLMDIPIVKYNIDRADTEDLTILHRMMYRKVGKQHNTKKNIRAFCGWPFERDSKEYKSVYSNIIERLLPAALKWTLDLLAIDRKDKDTEQMREAIIEFLIEPKMNDAELPSAKSKSLKRKSSSSSKAKNGTPKTKKSSSKSKPKKSKKDGDGSDVSEASSGSDSESDEDKEKSKKTTGKATKASPKKTPAKKTTQVKIAIPAKKAKSASKKKQASSSDDDSDDDKPLHKKGNSPPSDAELKKVVSAILKDADLEQVTMKTVVKQVYDKYSEFDLTSRKDFIKTTVKQLIS